MGPVRTVSFTLFCGDMTLNLMLTSRDAVYLSADFRLTSTRDQAAISDSYDTQKLIPVVRRDWSALIAYSGVASAPHSSMMWASGSLIRWNPLRTMGIFRNSQPACLSSTCDWEGFSEIGGLLFQSWDSRINVHS